MCVMVTGAQRPGDNSRDRSRSYNSRPPLPPTGSVEVLWQFHFKGNDVVANHDAMGNLKVIKHRQDLVL
jgi:hypothetical protein